ncbi:hypothetical protein [Nonomuraea sp. NPDC049480]|uniref:hypothetical protein n=1 Tax=Nonomuraea sp. NPDC049480 TaxID=3364353 RepID=UPI0037BC699E
MAVTRELLAYYEQDREHARLREGRGRLEFWRTQDVLRRMLPPTPARVLDVGGGTGVHAEWLSADGYEVGRYGLEGAFWLYGDVDDWLDDPERRALMLDAQRSMESVPSLLGVSGHMLTVARRDR